MISVVEAIISNKKKNHFINIFISEKTLLLIFFITTLLHADIPDLQPEKKTWCKKN